MSTGTVLSDSGAGADIYSAFLPFILSSIFIFIVFFLVYWLLKNAGRVKGKGNFFQIIASQPIDRFSNAHLIKLLEGYYIVLTTSSQVTILEKICEKEKVEELNLKFSKRNSSSFLSVFNKKLFDDQIQRLKNISDEKGPK